jgi:aminocarboxymuconate-semialdehyde decarboxylase
VRIDVHAHYWSESYLDLLAGLGRTDTATQRHIGAGGGAELEARLRLMDRAGVDIQVLSASPQLPYSLDTAAAVLAARFVNDEYAALVKAHPDRFRAFAALPLPDTGAALAEMGRALDELGMVGVTMTTSVLDRGLTVPELEPVFAELDRRGAVLYLHPAGNSACSPLVREHSLTWMVGALFEDTIAAMQLITAGYTTRYPAIKIISSHLGGALPMLPLRADDHVAWEAPDMVELPSVAMRRLWYDTVSHCHVPALRCAIDTFGADRILLGTDFPYEDGETFVRSVEYVAEAAADAAQAHAILETNAWNLFGL